MASKPLNIILFLGTTRIGRNGLRVAKYLNKTLSSKGYNVEFFDPLELNFPVLRQPMHFYPDPKDVPPELPKLNEKIKAADGYVIVAGEYNRSIPPALTNMMNHFPPSSYAFKPSVIFTYSVGRLGGSISAQQLNTFLSMLGSSPIPMISSFGEIHKLLDEEGNSNSDYFVTRVDDALQQFQWYASALKDKRDQVTIDYKS